MSNIVELRQMSDEKLQEKLDNAREELFNLRFQKASARLEDVSSLRRVRREIARLENVLGMRQLAIEAALKQPEVAAALSGKEWQAESHFDYEDGAWVVQFADDKDKELATTLVDLNKKKPKGRKYRQANSQQVGKGR
ncbi:MAG: 50S ribosomal protein L29 [Chloroflexi bacterium]|nr:50S ribosomal protein L29 [Chloroflexota bacterium]MCI0580490.1 50S ribosomal protein L29 [Chloroflexota bacterium]MCI0649234.1 50S ribosomal protein L29 [Chloroflexota bacterium]MCI0727954.1 50S ribosomal protein L29 [Chloroflexota bacterium]